MCNSSKFHTTGTYKYMSHYYNVQGNYISSLITLTQGGPLIFRWKMQSRLAFL